MSHHEGEELWRVQYPLNSDSYRILDEIGVGGSAIIYKAECIPMGSTLVAIKAIDLDQPRTDLDSVVREVKTMTLHSHPNILRAHCSFTVDRRVWIVMPFMSAGSLQSIIASSFPHGLPEPCIAIVLRETLNALAYLHDQGEVHRDIKAGNILVDSNGSVKLADFGASVLIYDNPTSGASGSLTSCFKLTEVAGTPYWMAPEVIHSHNGYGSKADIWSFGITALELAHGRPPLSHLPLSKSLLLKITNRFRNLDCEMSSSDQRKKFSKSFKNMVASCLHHDPCKRPTAEELLKCTFFKNCKSSEFLVNEVLVGLDSVEQRFKKGKLLRELSINFNDADDDAEEKGSSVGENIKQRRISGWNLNEDEFELVPVFPSENPFRKEVRFGGETIIPNPSRVNNPDIPSNPEVRVEARGSNPDNPSNTSSSSPTMEKIKEVQVEGSESNPDNPWNTSSSSPSVEEIQEIQGEARLSNPDNPGNTSSSSPTMEKIQEVQVERSESNPDNPCNTSSSSPSAEEIKEVQSEGNSSGAPQAADGSVEAAQPGGSISNYRDLVIALLKNLNESLESQKIVVRGILAQLTGEEVIISREDQLILENERLKLALEQEKRRNTALEMELQFHKI